MDEPDDLDAKKVERCYILLEQLRYKLKRENYNDTPFSEKDIEYITNILENFKKYDCFSQLNKTIILKDFQEMFDVLNSWLTTSTYKYGYHDYPASSLPVCAFKVFSGAQLKDFIQQKEVADLQINYNQPDVIDNLKCKDTLTAS